VGDKVTVSIPHQDGYSTVDKDGNPITATTSTGTIGADGSFVPSEGQVDPKDVVYSGNEVESKPVNLSSPNGSAATITDSNNKSLPDGQTIYVGDKVTVSIPHQDGYSTVDKDGNPI